MSGGNCALSVILLRGAPAVGKSTTARGLIEVLRRGAVVEVDHLRGIQADCDWHDRRQHAVALSVAAQCAQAFLVEGVSPVILVDTFGRQVLPDTQARLSGLGVSHIAASLWAGPDVLRERSLRRGDDDHELAMSLVMNAEIGATRWPGELLVDTSGAAPEEVVQAVLERAGWMAARVALLERHTDGVAL